MRMTHAFQATILLAALLCLLSACGGQESAAPQQSGPSVQVESAEREDLDEEDDTAAIEPEERFIASYIGKTVLGRPR